MVHEEINPMSSPKLKPIPGEGNSGPAELAKDIIGQNEVKASWQEQMSLTSIG